MSVDFSIIIPHRGNGLGLWATVESCQADLAQRYDRKLDPFTYEVIIITNGDPLDSEVTAVIDHLRWKGRLGAHIHYDSPIVPSVARQRGAEIAKGDILCFFDNHCLVDHLYFERVKLDFDKYPDIAELHSTTIFYDGQGPNYHYILGLDYNFWARGCGQPYSEYKPYQMAAGGHGGFAMRRNLFLEVGGYGPDYLLDGYAGEEMLLDLKLGRLGYGVYLDPRLVHRHFAGKRGYARHWTDKYYTNLLVCANVIGGEGWLYKVFESFVTRPHIRTGNTPWFEILETAYERSKDYSKELDSVAKMSLDELLTHYRRNQVAM